MASRTIDIIVLIILLWMGFFIRLHHLNAPCTDLHSWNQVSAATVIRNIMRDRGTFLKPRWDVLDHGSTEPKSGAEEFPIYHLLVAKLAPSEGRIIITGRLLSLFACMLGAIAFWSFVHRRLGATSAHVATAVFLFSPIGAFFGRTVSSDSFSIAASLIGLDCFDRYVVSRKRLVALVAIVMLTLSTLSKPYLLVTLAPAAWIIFSHDGRAAAKNPFFWATLLMPVLSTGLWIAHAASIGSLGNVLSKQGFVLDNTLFGPIELLWSIPFWKLIGWRIWRELLTPLPAILAVFAMFRSITKPRPSLMLVWLASMVLYLIVVRQGNMVHNYYQYPLLPPLAVLAGWAAQEVQSKWSKSSGAGVLAVISVIIAMSIFGYPVLKSFHRYDRSSLVAGRIIKQISSRDDRIIVWEADRDRKPQTFFYADREGWFFRRLRKDHILAHIDLGAAYLAVNLPMREWKLQYETAYYIRTNFTLVQQKMSVGRFRERRLIQVFDLRKRR